MQKLAVFLLLSSLVLSNIAMDTSCRGACNRKKDGRSLKIRENAKTDQQLLECLHTFLLQKEVERRRGSEIWDLSWLHGDAVGVCTSSVGSPRGLGTKAAFALAIISMLAFTEAEVAREMLIKAIEVKTKDPNSALSKPVGNVFGGKSGGGGSSSSSSSRSSSSSGGSRGGSSAGGGSRGGNHGRGRK
jgi:uncharacterized membrane protein YgcG